MEEFTFENNAFSYRKITDVNPQNYKKHLHRDFELLLFLSGNADYVIENQRFHLVPYNLVLSRPMEFHFMEMNDKNAVYERYYIHFNVDEFPKDITEKLMHSNTVLSLDAKNRIVKIFRIMKEYSNVFSPEKYPQFFKGLLTELVFIISLEAEHNDAVSVQEADDITAKALKYIGEHITENLTVNSIAEGIYVSPSNLSHKFSKYMQIGVMKYVKNKKIYTADKMLKSGMKPTLVASLFGYNEYSTFYRAYKEIFGIPPRNDGKNN